MISRSELAGLFGERNLHSGFGETGYIGGCMCPGCASAAGAAKAGAFLSPPTGAELSIAPGAIAAPPSEILIDGDIGGDEIDGYLIDLVAGETVMFSVYGSGATPLADTVLYVFDDLGNFITLDDDGGTGTNSLITYTATYTGTHIVGVSAFPGAGLTGGYTLDAVGYPGGDVVGDDNAGAAALTMGGITYGFVDAGPDGPYTDVFGIPFTEVDSYSFTTTAGLIYSFEVAGGADYASDPFNLPAGELDTVIVIRNEAGDILAVSDDINFPSDVSSAVSFFATESGTFYLDVFSYQPWSGGFAIEAQELNPADFNPLDSINWASANNVPFDASNTAYVYFGEAGNSFGEAGVSLGWNDYEIGQVMLALEEYEKILGVNYEVTTDESLATFRLFTTESNAFGAYMYPQDPQFGTQQGIAAFNVLSGGWSFDQQQSLERGGFSFAVILHEFGHGHGLAHPHDTGGGSEVMLGVTAPTGSLGVYDLNQGVYTVMSYNDAWETNPAGPSPFTASGIDNGWSATLGAFDIAILQERYGIINAYATGNDVYQLRDVQDLGTFYETIWDTGGQDEIRYDGALVSRIDLLAATIDYTPTGGGVVSFVDGVWGGYTIARGVVIENATGGEGNDVLLGNSAVNTLSGRGGDDVLVGRQGGDTLDGGAGFDIASYIDASSRVVASLDEDEGYLGDARHDEYISIEGLQGSAFNDSLEGDNGDNSLDGLAGDDDLDGENGNDTILGGAGNDHADGDNGNDTIDGGAGDDCLEGDNGVDTIAGGAGADYISGDNGNDVLAGGADNDRITGDNGADRITGGTGDDRLTGGNGGDVFVFGVGDGIDLVTDFNRRQDHIDLTGSGLSWATLNSNGNATLDDADAYITVFGGRTIIDLGAAAGGAAGVNTVTLLSATGLTESNFIFG